MRRREVGKLKMGQGCGRERVEQINNREEEAWKEGIESISASDFLRRVGPGVYALEQSWFHA